MFGKKAGSRSGATSQEAGVTIITPGCHFNGRLYCRGSSRIGGKVEGEIVSEGLLIIEEDAVISGKIKAEETIVQGRVKGEISATGRIELSETSIVNGDIIAPTVVIREGSQFNGTCSMATEGVVSKSQTPSVDKIPTKLDDGTVPLSPMPEVRAN